MKLQITGFKFQVLGLSCRIHISRLFPKQKGHILCSQMYPFLANLKLEM